MNEFKPKPVPDPVNPIIPEAQKLPPQESMDGAGGLNIPNAPLAAAGASGGGFKDFLLNNKWYVVAIVAGLGIMGVLAFLLLRPQQDKPVAEADITLEISAPETAPSGGEVVYKVKIQNNDPATLVDMDLELVYPEGVSYVSSTPKASNLSGSSFEVPDLSNGQNVSLIIKTVAQGNINDEKQLVARLHYQFDNFNSGFVKESKHTVKLVAADVVLDMTGPESANNSQVLKYEVFYRNNSRKDIDNARVQVTFPEGFVYAEASPKPSMNNNIWNVGTLKPQGTGKFAFQGSFKSNRPGEAATFKVEFLVLDENGNFFTQGSTSYTTQLSAQPLIVSHKLANNVQNSTVNPGDTVFYEISFQNNNSVVATGVTVVAQLDSSSLDFSSLKAESGQIQDNTITWNASSVKTLERLNPNEKGLFKFSVKVKNPATNDTSKKDLNIISNVKIRSNEAPTYQNGNEVLTKISSPATLKGSMEHVSGQLPPKVGQPSTFKVKLQLTNSSNDYGSGTLVGFIPIGVTFDPSSLPGKEAALVKYDASTGKLVWNVGILNAHIGVGNTPPRELTFNVTFTPAAAQVKQAVVLLKDISFTAKDTYTTGTTNLKAQTIQTDQIPGKSSLGRVVQ